MKVVAGVLAAACALPLFAKVEYRECCGRHLHGKGEDCHCGCHH